MVCAITALLTVSRPTTLFLPRQEPEGPDDKAVQVGDKSQLDYAAGGEEDEGQEQPREQEGEQAQQQQQEEQQAAPQPGEEEEEEEEALGDYQDR